MGETIYVTVSGNRLTVSGNYLTLDYQISKYLQQAYRRVLENRQQPLLWSGSIRRNPLAHFADPPARVWTLRRMVTNYQRHPTTVSGSARRRFIRCAFQTASREMQLLQSLIARADRESYFAQDLHAFCSAEYKVFAFDLESETETYLGKVPAAGPWTLSDVALPDGEYRIRIKANAYYWQNAQYLTTFRLSIESGEVVESLPACSGLRWNRTMLVWNWIKDASEAIPTDFSVWLSGTDPVDVSGAPTQVVLAKSPGAYALVVPQGGAPIYAAVCARKLSRKGPIARVTIPALPTTPDSPANQTAWLHE